MAKSELTYNIATDLAKGEAFMVFVGTDAKPIAYAKSHDFSFTPNMEEVSTKMSGKYKDSQLKDIDWKISVDALVSTTKGHLSADVLRQMAASGKPVAIKIAKFTLTDTEGVRKITIGDIRYQGMATVGEVQEKSAKGEYESVSTTFTGVGALKDSAGNEVGSAEAEAALQPAG